MEIWYDDATKEVKAVYSDRYPGRKWPDAGWITFQNDTQEIPRDLNPGAIADFTGLEPVVTTPAPARVLSVDELRQEELNGKLDDDTITERELVELLRLERGL